MNKNDFSEDMSIALGTKEITPMAMCQAMAVYANGGLETKPIAILSINDRNNNIIKDFRKEHKQKKRLISKKLATIMTKLLGNVINKGTGIQARLSGGLRKKAAGKTGTSQNAKDVWFAGFTPSLATVIWFGFDRGLSLGEGQNAGEVVAPIWGEFMQKAN